MGFLIALLWVIVKLVVIWGAAYILKVILDWVPIIPAPIKIVLWYIIVIVACVMSLIALIGLLSGAPMPFMIGPVIS